MFETTSQDPKNMLPPAAVRGHPTADHRCVGLHGAENGDLKKIWGYDES